LGKRIILVLEKVCISTRSVGTRNTRYFGPGH
jgi:hypothetical protein